MVAKDFTLQQSVLPLALARFHHQAPGARTRVVPGLSHSLLNAVDAGDTMPGEGQPLWLPAGNGPPILDCGRVERVMLGGDAVVGYLHYTDGCG